MKKLKFPNYNNPIAKAQEDTGVPFHRNFNSILRRDLQKQKNFLWASRLWFGRRKEPILGYVPKNDDKRIWSIRVNIQNRTIFEPVILTGFYTSNITSELIRWIEGGECKKGQVFTSLAPTVPKWDALPEFRFKNMNGSLEKS